MNKAATLLCRFGRRKLGKPSPLLGKKARFFTVRAPLSLPYSFFALSCCCCNHDFAVAICISIVLMGYSRSYVPRAPPRARRSFRHPALRLILLVLFIFDTLRVLSIHSHHLEAQRRTPPEWPAGKRIFIASQHWNSAKLLRDRWNSALVALAARLGPENVYVSIYESGSYDDTKNALSELDVSLGALDVQRTIRLDTVSHADDIARDPSESGWVHLHNATMILRRIPFLSRVRNRVLEPLDALASQGEHFDTILFLNDVLFSVRFVFPVHAHYISSQIE